jgi:hypothetical protein
MGLSYSAFALAVVVTGSALALGCGSSTDSGPQSTQPASRDEAARATCSKLSECNEIGPGKTYESADQCTVKQRANWDTLWPPQDCDGKIDQTAYNNCLDEIRRAECGNSVDLANIVLNKCAKAKVCSGGTT